MPISGPTTNHQEIRNWAQTHHLVPAELLPAIVNCEPAHLRLTRHEVARSQPDIRIVSWEDFFAKFDQMGLALVYNDDASGYNEILQRDEHSPYRSRSHTVPKIHN